MEWLVPFIKPRTTQTNLSSSQYSYPQSSSTESFSTNETCEDVSAHELDECRMEEEEEDNNVLSTSATTGNKNWSKKKVDVEEEEVKCLRSFQKVIEGRKEVVSKNSEKYENELFGTFVATQLNKFTAHEQNIARHQIQNSLFNIQMSQDQSQMTNQPGWNRSQHDSVPLIAGHMMQNLTS